MRNIDMRAVTTADDPTVNILAFFKVVASSQISPHSETVTGISRCKDSQKFLYANIGKRQCLDVPALFYIFRCRLKC